MPSTKYAGSTGRAAANWNEGSDACTTPAMILPSASCVRTNVDVSVRSSPAMRIV